MLIPQTTIDLCIDLYKVVVPYLVNDAANESGWNRKWNDFNWNFLFIYTKREASLSETDDFCSLFTWRSKENDALNFLQVIKIVVRSSATDNRDYRIGRSIHLLKNEKYRCIWSRFKMGDSYFSIFIHSRYADEKKNEIFILRRLHMWCLLIKINRRQ